LHPNATNSDKIEIIVTEQEAMSSDMDALAERVVKLEEENAKLMKMIEAMWFAPGMPGAPEAPDHPSFKK
jgi:hypothetical protein